MMSITEQNMRAAPYALEAGVDRIILSDLTFNLHPVHNFRDFVIAK